jgi:hypothetical protein
MYLRRLVNAKTRFGFMLVFSQWNLSSLPSKRKKRPELQKSVRNNAEKMNAEIAVLGASTHARQLNCQRGGSGRVVGLSAISVSHKTCKWLVCEADPCACKGSPTILSDFHHQLHCCERSLRSWFTVREEGEVAWLKSPNGLHATAEFQVHEKSSMKIFGNFP